jgi:hypothetical protein
VAHTYNPSTWEAKEGGLKVGGQLDNKGRCCFRNKKKFNILSHQGNANQNYIEIPSHPS